MTSERRLAASDMNPDQLKHLEERLLAMRTAIRELDETRRDSSGTVELDQTRTGRLSRMDALQLQAMSRAGQARSQVELRRIEAALERIGSGEFGHCIDCEEEIPMARLEANPVVTMCVGCAEKREAE